MRFAIRKCIVIFVFVLGVSTVAYGTPVGLISDSESSSEQETALTIGVFADCVNDRKMDIDSGAIEIDAVGVRISFDAFKRYKYYMELGETLDFTYSYVIQGEDYTADFNTNFIWGLGASALILKWDNGLQLGANLSYRQISNDLTKVSIDSATYYDDDTEISSCNTKGGFKEYQAALELSWKTEYFSPYIGIKCSEAEIDFDITVSGVARNASEEAKEKYGVFVGCTFSPKLNILPNNEQVSINVEGRLIDENAVSASLNFKF